MLDLRNNPGGVLEAAGGGSDAFLDAGGIVTADGRTPDSRFRMDATPGDLLAGKLIGVGAVGLTQILIWVIAGAAIIAISGTGSAATRGSGLTRDVRTASGAADVVEVRISDAGMEACEVR